MTDQSSTGGTGPESVDPEFAPDGLGTGGFGDDGLGTDLPEGDDLPGSGADRMEEATPGGSRSNEAVEEKADDPSAERHGPMVDDASIDWSKLDGAGNAGRDEGDDDGAASGFAPLP